MYTVTVMLKKANELELMTVCQKSPKGFYKNMSVDLNLQKIKIKPLIIGIMLLKLGKIIPQ